jgi:transcription-repair coupling factor
MKLNLFEDIKEIWNISFTNWFFVNLVNILPSLHNILIESLGSNYSYIVAYKTNSDIQKFLLSLTKLNKNNKFPLLAGFLYTLDEFGFERVNKVTTVAEWSMKGDLITLWPVGYNHPIRISYFGDIVEYIEIYDAVYNTKIAAIENIILGKNQKLPDFIDRKAVEVVNPDKPFRDLIVILTQKQLEQNKDIINFDLIHDFDFEYPEVFFNNFSILKKRISDYESMGIKVQIQTNRSDVVPKSLTKYITQKFNYHFDAGFVSLSQKICVLTDRELFGTIFLSNKSKNISSKQARKILERLEGEIQSGDFVVHEDHGIGIYGGLVQKVNTKRILKNFIWVDIEEKNDYLQIDYAEGDQLLIPITQLQKITKYLGTTEEDPVITRLHKGTWQTIINKTKKAIKLIARELVQHYAKLELANTNPFDYEHSSEFEKFISNFPYEETPDQLQVSDEIYKDLTRNKPMDRLIVGDVGFGKTEVAMRAAFRAIENGFQVAVLCPTTVLSAQHFKVFSDRFKDFGIRIEYISRFNTPSKNKEFINLANEGKIDILIGTHRLLSSDVHFNNLGLIVIDEEQKFGVKQKEKIRKLQYSAHTLSMTATPIPRTLSMAMSEIKDISIMTTPPKERMSVHTEVEKQDWNKIVNQLLSEHSRGGQSYFVHNRVETIQSIAQKLADLMPNLRIGVAHGQMNSRLLDTTISDFYARKYDVLVCTTIIENGIDMPNVNTIIINNGQNFGLGQLYQLRGRVGRSSKKAFCYIYYKGTEVEDSDSPTEDENTKKKKTLKYLQRLKAILESQELGSGFKLASRDLEIRGAGSLLGEQQHGNIKNVGLGLYMQMLAEEVEQLKLQNDYKSQSNT